MIVISSPLKPTSFDVISFIMLRHAGQAFPSITFMSGWAVSVLFAVGAATGAVLLYLGTSPDNGTAILRVN